MHPRPATHAPCEAPPRTRSRPPMHPARPHHAPSSVCPLPSPAPQGAWATGRGAPQMGAGCTAGRTRLSALPSMHQSLKGAPRRHLQRLARPGRGRPSAALSVSSERDGLPARCATLGLAGRPSGRGAGRWPVARLPACWVPPGLGRGTGRGPAARLPARWAALGLGRCAGRRPAARLPVPWVAPGLGGGGRAGGPPRASQPAGWPSAAGGGRLAGGPLHASPPRPAAFGLGRGTSLAPRWAPSRRLHKPQGLAPRSVVWRASCVPPWASWGLAPPKRGLARAVGRPVGALAGALAGAPAGATARPERPSPATREAWGSARPPNHGSRIKRIATSLATRALAACSMRCKSCRQVQRA